jgi:hypothetical protein
MKFILRALGFFIWPFLFVGVLTLLGVTIYSFIIADFSASNYTYFIDLFNPCNHTWIRALYVVWFVLSLYAGKALSQL